MSSGVNSETMAADLIRALSDLGLRADRFTTGPEAAGINVWGEVGRYPLASVTIGDNAQFGDIAWGRRYEHTLPLSTSPGDAAAAIPATLQSSLEADDDA